MTFIAPKEDGRYCISNGKDQALKLWDLRMMVSDESFDKLRLDKVDYGIPGWDYRCVACQSSSWRAAANQLSTQASVLLEAEFVPLSEVVPRSC